MNWIIKSRTAKQLLLSRKKCWSRKVDGTNCADHALRGSRYCFSHQSKIPYIVALVSSAITWTATQTWSYYHPSEELTRLRQLSAHAATQMRAETANLSIIEAKADLGNHTQPIIGAKWKNFGNR